MRLLRSTLFKEESSATNHGCLKICLPKDGDQLPQIDIRASVDARMYHDCVVGINPCPAVKLVQQTHSQRRSIQKRCLDIVGAKHLQKCFRVLERGRIVVLDHEVFAEQLSSAVDERRHSGPDQITSEILIVEDARNLPLLQSRDGGSRRHRRRRRITARGRDTKSENENRNRNHRKYIPLRLSRNMSLSIAFASKPRGERLGKNDRSEQRENVDVSAMRQG
ncbi:MAG TPA: hypothetical protein VGC86_11260, partial [Afipia sp.]